MRILKNTVLSVLFMSLMLSIFGCNNSSMVVSNNVEENSVLNTDETSLLKEEKKQLIVFASASMTETLTEISNNYMVDYPNIEILFNFDSSGTLKTQIEEGSPCDFFISAALKQMDQLDIEADKETNKNRLDFIKHSTRFNLLENKVALSVTDGNPASIESFEQLISLLKMLYKTCYR